MYIKVEISSGTGNKLEAIYIRTHWIGVLIAEELYFDVLLIRTNTGVRGAPEPSSHQFPFVLRHTIRENFYSVWRGSISGNICNICLNFENAEKVYRGTFSMDKKSRQLFHTHIVICLFL